MSRSDQEDSATDWVVALPPKGEPRFAVLPWPLFQRLLALAERARNDPAAAPVIPAAPSGLPQDVRRRFAVIVNDTPPAGSPEDWDGSLGGLPDFDAVDRLEADRFPPEVLERLLDGDHPVKVFREYRGLTQRELADLAGINATYLSQIETRNRGGSTRVYRRLAVSLDVNLDDLVE